MPSTMTMALSTSIPMAMIKAPRLIRSTLTPNRYMKKNVASTVSKSDTPTTTEARTPMNSASTPITTPTDRASDKRKLLLASSTTRCCS